MLDQWTGRDRGSGRLGCLVSLAMLAAFCYLAYQVVPIYFRANEFRSAVELEVARAGALRIGDQELRRTVLNLASAQGIPLREGGLKIVRSSSQLSVTVGYDVPIRLAGYTRSFHFGFRATSIVGSL